MRVSEETLIRGWVGMDWSVSRGRYWVHTTLPTYNISLLSHARQRKNIVLRWLGVHAGGRGAVYIYQLV